MRTTSCGAASSTAASIARRRSASRRGCPVAPRATSSMIAAGSSLRGLSEVMKTRSVARDELARAPARFDLQVSVHADGVIDDAPGHRPEAVADGADAAGEPSRELLAERLIEVEHGRLQSFHGKEPRLRFAVGLHRAVVVEVIVREIGEK